MKVQAFKRVLEVIESPILLILEQIVARHLALHLKVDNRIDSLLSVELPHLSLKLGVISTVAALVLIILVMRNRLDYVENPVINVFNLGNDSFPPVLQPSKVVTQILFA